MGKKKKKNKKNTLKSTLLEVLSKITELYVVPPNKKIDTEITIMYPKYPLSSVRSNLGIHFLITQYTTVTT